MKHSELTADRLRELLHYEPDSGVFVWRKTTSNKALEGDVAGCWSRDRLLIGINRRLYQAHRLAWLYVHGRWPVGVIDHINGDARDNRLANLRDVTQTVNQQNRRKACAGSTSQLLGICWAKERQQWVAQIRIPGQGKKTLGYRNSEAEAYELYLAAKRKYHAGCTI